MEGLEPSLQSATREELSARIVQQAGRIAELEAIVAELQRRLGRPKKDSANSSVPPSQAEKKEPEARRDAGTEGSVRGAAYQRTLIISGTVCRPSTLPPFCYLPYLAPALSTQKARVLGIENFLLPVRIKKRAFPVFAKLLS